jgi:hypothetical protein
MMDNSAIISAMQKAGTLIDHMAIVRSRLDRKLATKFSIFDPTGYHENIMSKVIRLLLDPNGSHAQGESFLRAFLETLSDSRNVSDFLNLDLTKANVSCEWLTCKGRKIDVVVEIGKKRFGIENKLWAADQQDQVSHYLKSVDFLVYLTIDRGLPSVSSIPLEECKAAIEKGNLLIMQYKHRPQYDSDIADADIAVADFSVWLNKCLHLSESDKIRWYLQELITLIDVQFYEESVFMGDYMLKDILLKNDDVFDVFLELKGCQYDLEEALVANFFTQLKIRLDERLKDKTNWKLIYTNKDARKAWNDSFFRIERTSGGYICIAFDIRDYRNMYCGWTSEKYQDKFKKVFSDFKHNQQENENIWEFIKELDNLTRIDCMKELKKFMDDPDNSQLTETVTKLVDKIVRFIGEVDKAE